jgi:hypothetical protein
MVETAQRKSQAFAFIPHNVRKGMVCGTYGDGKRSFAVYDSSVLTGPSQRDMPKSPC